MSKKRCRFHWSSSSLQTWKEKRLATFVSETTHCPRISSSHPLASPIFRSFTQTQLALSPTVLGPPTSLFCPPRPLFLSHLLRSSPFSTCQVANLNFHPTSLPRHVPTSPSSDLIGFGHLQHHCSQLGTLSILSRILIPRSSRRT